MKLAIDVSQVVYGTGVSSYIRYLVPELQKLLDEPPTLFAGVFKQKNVLNQWLGELQNNHKDRIYPIPPKLADILWNDLRLPIDPLIGQADVFHSSDWTQPKTKAQKTTTVHDVIAYKFPENLDPYIVTVQKKRMEQVKRECDLIIAVSFATKNDLVEILGVDESKIRVVHSAAANIFKPQPPEVIKNIKTKYQIKNEYLLYVGTREPRKNLTRVINAYNNSESAKNNCDLIIVGKFGWGEDIRPVLGVKTLGFVNNEDLPALYSGAKLFLYPSLYEGFGIPVLEAMASGCPVITSDRGSLKEIVGGAAIVVNPESEEEIKNAIEGLLNKSPIEYNEIVQKGLINSRKYSWEKTAKETLAVYQELFPKS